MKCMGRSTYISEFTRSHAISEEQNKQPGFLSGLFTESILDPSVFGELLGDVKGNSGSYFLRGIGFSAEWCIA